MHKNKDLISFILLTLSLANIVAHCLAGDTAIQAHLLNSDALYLPTLFSDLLSKNGNISAWFLTPAPCLFPDYPIFLLSYLVGPKTYSQIVIFSLLQAILTFAAIWFLARKLFICDALFTASTITISLIWLALNCGDPFSFLLSSAFHYGIFLTSIVFIALLLQCKDKEEKQGKVIAYALIATLAFLSTLSDNLFIVQVIVPLAATTILGSITERGFSQKFKFPTILAVVFGILGSISYRLIVSNKTRYAAHFGLEKLFTNLNGIYDIFYGATINNPIFGVLFLLYMGLVSYSLFQLIAGTPNSNKFTWLNIFTFLSLCTTLATVVLVTNLPITPRYLIPTLSWPVIAVFIFLSNHLPGRRFVFVATVVSLLATASLSWSSYKLIEKNGLNSNYYPSDISCIDDVLEKEQATNGIAQYYDAKYLQNFSRLDLNIAQHYDNLSEQYWITSKKYFKQNYDFAIISEKAEPPYKISSEALIRLNGIPKLVRSCGNRSIYIYGKDKLRVK